MADAAGIAEGTIFRVFPDKAALILEAVKVSVAPEPVQRELEQIHPDAPLSVQLGEAARILLDRFQVVIALLAVLRTMPVTPETHHAVGPPQFVAVANAAINESLTEIFERHRSSLRIEPARAAAAFRGLILASGHPTMSLAERLTTDEIVSVLLNGISEFAPIEVG